MKRISKIIGLLLAVFTLAACSNMNSDGNIPSNTETFSKTTVFNPNTTKVILVSVKTSRSASTDEDIICEIESLEKKEIELGDEHTYYFTDTDGNKIADLSKGDNGEYLPVYLELNEPKEGKEYLLLNQYKNADFLESFPRNPGTTDYYETYQFFLYEIVNADDLDAYKYNDEIYIRAYPSANYWIDSEGYASNKIGTRITYNSDFRDNLKNLSNPWVAWGWSTYDSEFDMWFCHRVVSYILHAVDGNNYTVKDLQETNKNHNIPASANHISVKNVSNGIEVTITRKNTDPKWQYGVVYITENGQKVGCSYSYFQNNKCILDDVNNTHTFLFPFTTKDTAYTFSINPYDLYSETVEIVAENTTKVQLQNLSNLKNFKVLYEEKDDSFSAKRIVKVTESPFNIFTNPAIVRYQQLCVNTYSVDNEENYTWIFNFGHNGAQQKLLLNEGLDFIGNNDSNILYKSAEEFINELNKGEKINFTAHFQFNTEPYSETSGNFIISLGSYTFDWKKIN